MKHSANICRVLLCLAISFVSFRCTNDSLDTNKHQWSVPFAFVSGSGHPGVTLNDTAANGLSDTITVVQNADVWFIGLVSNARTQTTMKGTWNYGDGHVDQTMFDSSYSIKHTFADIGRYRGYFTIIDALGDSAVDSVMVTVVTRSNPSPAGPVIVSKRSDTTVTVDDLVSFFAAVRDSVADIVEYTWDFDDNGSFDYSSSTTDSTFHAYATTGIFRAVLRVTDKNFNRAFDTVTITVMPAVSPFKLQWEHTSPNPVDTVEYGDIVRCSVSVINQIDNLSFEIDTLQTGRFIPMAATGFSAAYTFKMDTAAIIDSVKIRVFAPLTDTLSTQFRIFVRPRPLAITAIDSTFSTITVHWTRTLENAFQEYLIYRGQTAEVDTTGTPWALIRQARTVLYTTPVPSYASLPLYYRLYQRDKNGLLSPGSNVVFGNIQNSPPAKPLFVNPSGSNDTILSNAVVRWNRSVDPNGDTVSYELLYDRGNGFVSYAKGIADTFFALTGLDTPSFSANIIVVARDSHGSADSSELTNIFFKQAPSNRMFVISKGSYRDSLGKYVTITYDFLMDSVEVTQLSYKMVMNGNDPSSSIADNQPVETVTWYQAIRYCNAASKALNLDTAYAFMAISPTSATALRCDFNVKAVRLPTEDEWELAARGGKNFLYATDDASLSCSKVNYNGPCPAPFKPAVAGSYPPNPYRMHEMTGNVGEWCWDVFSPRPPDSFRVDYTGAASAATQAARVIRGGDFQESNPGLLQTDSRRGATPVTASPRVGFRCVIPLKQ